MVLNINQFAQSSVQGQVDLTQATSNIVGAQVSTSQATALVAGQAVKMENSAYGVPKVLALTALTDVAWGIVIRNVKDASFVTGAMCEVALIGTVVTMTANGAIARDARVSFDYTTNKVAAYTGTYPTLGYAFDKAAADGDLIRVYVTADGLSSSAVNELIASATLAEINAGKIIIPGVAGKQIIVTSFIERVTGAFTTTTSVNLQSDTTAVIVEASAVAGLTNGAILVPGSANVTLGAGFGVALPAGEGLKVVNVGSAAAGGTSIAYTINYAYV